MEHNNEDLVFQLLQTHNAVRYLHEDLWMVKDKHLLWALYVPSAQVFVTSFDYTDIETTSVVHLARVRKHGKWGLLCLEKNELVLLIDFDEIDVITDNFFAVKKDGRASTCGSNTKAAT